MHMMNETKNGETRESVKGMEKNKSYGRSPDKAEEMTNEEYRERIIAIFAKMDRMDKLRFWYKYISAIEKEED